MTRHIFKSILLGLLIGTALFMLPFFLLKFLFFLMIVGAIFRLIRRRNGWGRQHHFAFADKIRNMNDEEYTSFKEKMQNRHHRHHYYHNHHHHYNGCYNDGPKKTTNKNETGINDQQESSL